MVPPSAAALLALMLGTPAAASDRDVSASVPVSNVEDMAYLENTHWVLASSMASLDVESSLYAISKSGNRVVRIYPLPAASAQNTASETAPKQVDSTCDREPAADEYSGHGIAFRATATDGGKLYVVNHGRGETIEIFDVGGLDLSRKAPTVSWRSCIVLPNGNVGNAVTVTPDGRIYATLTKVRGGMPRSGSIGFWTEGEGWRTLADDLHIPAGLTSDPDGRMIYVTSFFDRKVYKFPVAVEGGPRRELALGFEPDNLGWAKDGSLLIGGLEGLPSDIMQACQATSDPRCNFPGFVARIDVESFVVTCTIALGPTVTTTVAQVGRDLWIGSSRSPKIWRARTSALTRCPARIEVSR